MSEPEHVKISAAQLTEMVDNILGYLRHDIKAMIPPEYHAVVDAYLDKDNTIKVVPL